MFETTHIIMLDQSLQLARKALLSPTSLTDSHLATLIEYLDGHQVDGADLYFQSIHHEAWSLENGLVKSGQFDIEQGVGMRAIRGSQVGFSYSQSLHFEDLMQAAKTARSIVPKSTAGNPKVIQTGKTSSELYSISSPLTSVEDQEKLALLYPLDALAKGMSQSITQFNASIQAQHEIILLVCGDGRLMADIRPMIRLQVRAIAERHGMRESGYASEALRGNYRDLIDHGVSHQLVQEAVQNALLNLDAKPAPAGSMPVVLGPGGPGVLIHEAVGHGLEGDFNRKGSSAFSKKLNQPVASDLCTIVDNGTLPGHCGSLNMDDEGTPTQNTSLIENGILKQYMQDNLNAKLMHTHSTGNGRRESYRHLPMPRMTNTYILPGKDNPADIIASVKYGIYAAEFSGGQVDITSGKFVFSASKAFLIQNGKITHPVKGATLIGNGPDVLNRVSAVGNDLKIEKNGWCGKEGQTVPVSVGQPTLKVDHLTVGGTVQS